MFGRRSRSTGDGDAPRASADGPGAGEDTSMVSQTQPDEPETAEVQPAPGGPQHAVDPADGSIAGAIFALQPAAPAGGQPTEADAARVRFAGGDGTVPALPGAPASPHPSKYCS